MSTDDLLDILGKHFRGLWISNMIGEEGEGGWACTFVHGGDYLETHYWPTRQGALREAVGYLVDKGAFTVSESERRGLDEQQGS